MRVAIIIPARDEAEALRHVLTEVPRAAVHEIIVVDNGSTDQTAAVAAGAGVRVVREPRPGYGRACLAGLAALDPSVDTVAFLDGDHADYPEELPMLLAPLAQGRADLVIGSRLALAEPGSLTVPQRVGNRLACALLRWRFGARHTDLGPFRAIRREALERLDMRDEAFGWTVEMQAKAAREGLRVAEVPTRYRRRIGRSKISGTLSGTLRAGIAILSMIVRVAWKRRSGLGTGGWGHLPRARSPEPSAVLQPRTPTQSSSTRRLLIFVKYPTPGSVKTRIAATVGPEAAGVIARACAELTLERLRAFRQETSLFVEPAQAMPRAREWLGEDWPLRPQVGEDLGARLRDAVRRTLTQGAGRVVIIGTDSPWLSPREIDAAFEALRSADLVLGPTEDGGYYLIGLSRSALSVFEGIAWSTPSVYAATLAKACELGLRVRALPQGYDLDRTEDVRRFLNDEATRGNRSARLNAIEAAIQVALTPHVWCQTPF